MMTLLINRFSSYTFFLRIVFILSICLFPFILSAQISHGGKPLPIDVSTTTRAVSPAKIPFVEMSSINNMELLRSAEVESGKFKSLEFAHKFHVFLRPNNSGINFTVNDMNVWRVGIRSKTAYSLNILFSKFRLPQGARVFVYNVDQSEILGSYTHQNNTNLNLLPVQPIVGDEIIVEYQEPLNAEFKGEIEIGEVNHDFRGLFRAAEPRDPEQSCHPNIVCYPEDIQPGSGVVALIINGTGYCTGSLINNSANDGTPYLITATHCLNEDYCINFLKKRKYDLVAGSIIALFGYQSPVCSKEMRGITQMSVASADSVLILESHDISLLKFKDASIPVEYQPYYLGWNVSSMPQAPFHGIHHPNGGVKKIAIENDALNKMVTFTITSRRCGNTVTLSENAHWDLQAWDIGATEGGSSGSPLLDKNKRIVGTLTGGTSYCSSPKGPDQYAALYKAWNTIDTLGNPNALKHYLDPINSQTQNIDGFNPYLNQPFTKSSNYSVADTVIQSYHNSVPMFSTNNTFGYTEFAEEFKAATPTKLEGVFVASPITDNVVSLNVKIKVYADNNGSPGTLLHEAPLNYSFRYYQAGNFYETGRNMRKDVENYIKFASPVHVSGKFYIAYSEANSVSNGFSVLNVRPRKIGSGIASTAWMKNASGWVRSSENMENPTNTSLLIAPYVVGKGLTPIDPPQAETEIKAYYNKSANRIFIESNKDLISWEIFYVSGQKVFEGKAESSINRTSFPIGHLAKGVYVVTVKVDGSTKNVKVLVR